MTFAMPRRLPSTVIIFALGRRSMRDFLTMKKLLDLFCGAGGAAKGYNSVGFEVTGIDIATQPHYPFEFFKYDVLKLPLDFLLMFDVIHASPPCQAYSECTPIKNKPFHPKIIREVSNMLRNSGKPYVIENVEGARGELRSPIMLCGTMFGLKVWRHRYFEIFPFWSLSPMTCNHAGHPVTIRGGSNARKAQGGHRDIELERESMGIDWTTETELSQAIPPAYTEWIGRQLMKVLTP